MSFLPFDIYIKYSLPELKAYEHAIVFHLEHIRHCIAQIEPKEKICDTIVLGCTNEIEINSIIGIKALRDFFNKGTHENPILTLKETKSIIDELKIQKQYVMKFPFTFTEKELHNLKTIFDIISIS